MNFTFFWFIFFPSDFFPKSDLFTDFRALKIQEVGGCTVLFLMTFFVLLQDFMKISKTSDHQLMIRSIFRVKNL